MFMWERIDNMATLPSQGKLLYHITHTDNLPSILEHGLMPRRTLLNYEYRFVDIADPNILSKREEYQAALSQFVLFHFYPKNPFDGAVCNSYGSENMAIITISRGLYRKYNFHIIPSHPLNSDTPEIYPYEEGIKQIRWDILDRTGGLDRDYRNPEIRKACMAECISEYTILPDDFSFIYVCTDQAKDEILSMNNSNLVNIQVRPYMFP